MIYQKLICDSLVSRNLCFGSLCWDWNWWWK